MQNRAAVAQVVATYRQGIMEGVNPCLDREESSLFEIPKTYREVNERWRWLKSYNLKEYIKAKQAKKIEYKERVIVHQNLVEIKQNNQPILGGERGGLKKPMLDYSSKSRRNFIKTLCKLKRHPKLWQDFTFPDDVMEGLSIAEKRDYSNATHLRFRNRIDYIYKESYEMIWKREWQPRKSGALKGQYVPHYHFFIRRKDYEMTWSEYRDLALELATIWVNCTKSLHPSALSVAINEKSYREIRDAKEAAMYAVKYVGKKGEISDFGESIGRSWGRIGKLEMKEAKVIDLSPDEMVRLKRMLRHIVPKKHHMQTKLRNREESTFVIVQGDTVERMIDFIREGQEMEVFEFFDERILEQITSN